MINAMAAVRISGLNKPAEATRAAAKAGPITVPTLKPEVMNAICDWRSAWLVLSAT